MPASLPRQTYFEDNPRDLQLLRHDLPLHPAVVKPHLGHVPDYLGEQGWGTGWAFVPQLPCAGLTQDHGDWAASTYTDTNAPLFTHLNSSAQPPG